MRKKYVNADGSSNLKSLAELRKWQKERRLKKKDLSFTIPRVEPDVALLSDNREKPTVTFIGHSTFLVQLGGLNIVTDPVWATRMGLGARLSPPGVPIKALPPIDVVVLSHAHYDHLHLGSLRDLPGDFVLLVPEGLGGWLRRKGFRHVEELSWWSEKHIGGVTFGFVPAKHWTRRTPWDTNSSHWGGWVMHHGLDCLYFAGDSGYDGIFREIGKRYSDIRVALIPIGAYEPEWFMRDSHMTPKEALDRLLAEWERRELPMEQLWTMELGKTKLWSAEATLSKHPGVSGS